MGMLKMRCTTTPNGPPYIFANQTYIRCFCPDYTGSASRLSSAKLGGGGAPRHSSHSVDLAPLAQSNPVWLVSYSAWASPFVPENCPTWFFGG